VSRKRPAPLLAPPPSAPHPSSCGTHFYQRSPSSGTLRCWLLPREHWNSFRARAEAAGLLLRRFGQLSEAVKGVLGYPSGSRECPADFASGEGGEGEGVASPRLAERPNTL